MGNARTAPLTLLLVLAACAPGDGGPTAAPPPGTATPSATAARSDESAPRDCGTWNLAQGGELSAEVDACLSDAVRDRRPARLVVTQPTVEGDPVTTSYLVRRDGRVEVTTDDRLDRFGSGRVERRTCEAAPAAAGRPVFTNCSPPEPG